MVKIDSILKLVFAFTTLYCPLVVANSKNSFDTIIFHSRSRSEIENLQETLEEKGLEPVIRRKKNDSSPAWLFLVGPVESKKNRRSLLRELRARGFYRLRPYSYDGKKYISLGSVYSRSVRNNFRARTSGLSVRNLKSKSKTKRIYYELRAKNIPDESSDETPVEIAEAPAEDKEIEKFEFLFNWQNEFTLEGRFFELPTKVNNEKAHFSFLYRPKYSVSWDNDRKLVSVNTFFRYDNQDTKRSHPDIRELSFTSLFGNFELKLGLGKVFWGVVESIHLVDIVNQTDLVEDIDLEEKLGQPLLNLKYIGEYGVLSFFLLPLFRTRTFPSLDGRPSFGLKVDTRTPNYQSTAKDKHIDYAVRYTHTFGDLDLGISFFSGTLREPDLIPGFNDDGELVLVPYYPLVEQYGLELNYILGGLILKMEGIRRQKRSSELFEAIAGGFEYTFFGFLSKWDLSVLLEYIHDNRKSGLTFFEDDFFVAGRLAFNDLSSSEILAGFYIDKETNSKNLRVEVSQRFSKNVSFSLEYTGFQDIDSLDSLNLFQNENYFKSSVSLYF